MPAILSKNSEPTEKQKRTCGASKPLILYFEDPSERDEIVAAAIAWYPTAKAAGERCSVSNFIRQTMLAQVRRQRKRQAAA